MKLIKSMYYALLTLALVATLGIVASAAPVTDVHIESSINQSYVFRHYLRDDDIKIRSKNGIVTLTGRVSTPYHKRLANDTAAAQQGVKIVNNRLEIDASAPAIASDAWLIGKVKTVLLFHRSVSAIKTQVNARDGVITLRGAAENQAQKDLTAEYVRDVEGVRDVDNELTIPKTPSTASRLEGKIDDASITAEVKLTLLFHRSTSTLNTHVETRDGIVTLSGSAKSTAEKDLAEKIISDVNGVKSVDNRISVDRV